MRLVTCLALTTACDTRWTDFSEELDAGRDVNVKTLDCPGRREVNDTFANLTGRMLTSAGARGIADAFGRLPTAPETDCGSAGIEGTFTCECSGGGTVVAQVHADYFSSAVYDYQDCCVGNCCFDGCGAFAQSGGDLTPFKQCSVFSGTISCAEPPGADLAYCYDGGLWAYLVQYNGASFAVSGTYDTGVGGEWTVFDAGGVWSCVEDETATGTCTTDGGYVITW